MTAKVIQGLFIGGGRRPLGPVAQPKAQHHAPPRPPVPAFAGRTPVMQPRLPGPPAPAFAGRPPVVQPHGAGDAFPVDPAQLGLASGGGRPLPEALRGRMEAALGADFSAVRVHVGPQAERIGAIAFTLGSDIYFAPGRFQPDTAPGQQLLGHELAHVVQQRQGRVRNPMGSGIAVVQDRALEAEADRLGQRAAAHRVAVQPKMTPGAAPPLSPARPSSAGADFGADQCRPRQLPPDRRRGGTPNRLGHGACPGQGIGRSHRSRRRSGPSRAWHRQAAARLGRPHRPAIRQVEGDAGSARQWQRPSDPMVQGHGLRPNRGQPARLSAIGGADRPRPRRNRPATTGEPRQI